MHPTSLVHDQPPVARAPSSQPQANSLNAAYTLSDARGVPRVLRICKRHVIISLRALLDTRRSSMPLHRRANSSAANYFVLKALRYAGSVAVGVNVAQVFPAPPGRPEAVRFSPPAFLP